MNSKEILEKFEEWHLSLHGSTERDLEKADSSIEYLNEGDYLSLKMRVSWQAYQQAASDMSKRIVELEEALRNCKVHCECNDVMTPRFFEMLNEVLNTDDRS